MTASQQANRGVPARQLAARGAKRRERRIQKEIRKKKIICRELLCVEMLTRVALNIKGVGVLESFLCKDSFWVDLLFCCLNMGAGEGTGP